MSGRAGVPYTRLVATCPACGKELPGEFPFCPFCGASLADDAPAAGREERKVVSVLFCDLVGFTAASEAVDPEDVRARIRPYHARLRQEIERYDGTVEKFVGDAVMAVFGAPVAHEDDAERAVRAGLKILDAIGELNEANPSLELQVRVGISTGEAVVVLGARPEQGEGIVTGDVVNTASRLQGAAPVNGIACSEQTFRQTERIFNFEPLDPVQVKGKAEPLRIWRPLRPYARFGSDVTRADGGPLVGRELEKPLLIGTFERSAQQRSCQLVTIVGEPGVGKSRLCAELLNYVEDRPGLVRWRQGRCLPYGDGIAFWALGEIVKAECGILETDSPDEAAAKLERALPEGEPEDRAWLSARLAALVGAPAEPAAQEESFTAWRRFLESLAAEGPTVLVFEDLHWADRALLSFLEHLADWSEGVPLLILCTARPELLEQHATWGAGLRNATTINLSPLTEEETARLIAALLERAVMPAETQQALLERAGGNPLYAEEFVRLLVDRDQEREAVDDVPDSVHALIAARLDTLPPERKNLLQDASVVGKVFWAGALVEMGGRDPHEVEQALHELARKELVRPARTSSMHGEQEYGFWHLLVRDVAYGQIPRAARADKHRAAAAWLERKAGERAEDLADVLAHHYLTALELARAAGRVEITPELEAAAIRSLSLAGERALALDLVSAEASLAKALELAPEGHPERASLLERWAQAAQAQGRLHEAQAAFEKAIALYREQREPLAAGRALSSLVVVFWALGDPRRKPTIAEALAVLEEHDASPELVAALAELAGVHWVDCAFPEAIAAGERARQLASDLGLPEPARALGFEAAARYLAGDRRGLDELRRAVSLSLEQGKGRAAAVDYGNLAIALGHDQGPEAGLAAGREAVEFCERRGIGEVRLTIATVCPLYLADLGRTDAALAEAELLAEQAEATGNFPAVCAARSLQLRLRAQRGDEAQTGAAEELAARSRASGTMDEIALGFLGAVQGLLAARRRERAEALLHELAQIPGVHGNPFHVWLVPEVVRCTLSLGELPLAEQFASRVRLHTHLSEHAVAACRAQLAEAAGDHARAAVLYTDAARHWVEFGNVPERAYALLGQSRSLLALGDAGTEVAFANARGLFQSMGYRPALAEIDGLLAHGKAAAR
jgi:class 3 adenylate cyclase